MPLKTKKPNQTKPINSHLINCKFYTVLGELEGVCEKANFAMNFSLILETVKKQTLLSTLL